MSERKSKNHDPNVLSFVCDLLRLIKIFVVTKGQSLSKMDVSQLSLNKPFPKSSIFPQFDDLGNFGYFDNIPKNQFCLNLIDIICFGSKDSDWADQ